LKNNLPADKFEAFKAKMAEFRLAHIASQTPAEIIKAGVEMDPLKVIPAE